MRRGISIVNQQTKNARNLLRRPVHHYSLDSAHVDLHPNVGMRFFSSNTAKDLRNIKGSSFMFRGQYGKQYMLPRFTRTLASDSSQASRQTSQEGTKKDISTVDDPFDAPTYHIPEKPVTFTEGASYSVVILAGLGVAGLAAYAVFKELIFEPKEYKIFGKALERVQHDSQVTVRIGSPVTGYGSESRNRAARQRIPNRVWTDEDGVEHVQVNFYIRGPRGAGMVYAEMFKDGSDGKWRFTYLIVEIKSPSPTQLMLESYVPA
ncbi:probable mitochondrial import inner membrane translocase subunit TIM21 [Asparagus officinalis]|uniref:probable mitochondrial import inner membrane translocase subunit TIM21 n=1 Tax=Asparagus officinalis TaxID=4686 RepID=UPI00098DE3A6|nr:probable mitochondrial import inner membrane translocase subunit TIM21 [Asparagus officinalis]